MGGIDSRIDQVSHTVDQGPRLAAAGAGNDQRWPFTRSHSRKLLAIQRRRIVDGELPGNGLVNRTLQHIRFGFLFHKR